MFRRMGIPVWSADDAVHALYGPGGAAVGPVSEICPEAVTVDGVDRSILSEWIAATPGALSKIEAVVHPLVADDRKRFLGAAHSDIVVVDVPLLFETGGESAVDAVVVVTAPEDEQRRRVLARDGMTEAKLAIILSKQMPDAEKRQRADFIIEATSLEAAYDQVQNVVQIIRSRLANA